MCTVLWPPGVNPIAVNKYIIISYHIKTESLEKLTIVGKFWRDLMKIIFLRVGWILSYFSVAKLA
jgi:hypothetical protein